MYNFIVKILGGLLDNIYWFLENKDYRDNRNECVEFIKKNCPDMLDQHLLLEKLGFVIYTTLNNGAWRYRKRGFDYEPVYLYSKSRFIWLGHYDNNFFDEYSFEEVFNSFSEKDKKIILFKIDLLQ